MRRRVSLREIQLFALLLPLLLVVVMVMVMVNEEPKVEVPAASDASESMQTMTSATCDVCGRLLYLPIRKYLGSLLCKFTAHFQEQVLHKNTLSLSPSLAAVVLLFLFIRFKRCLNLPLALSIPIQVSINVVTMLRSHHVTGDTTTGTEVHTHVTED